MALQRLCRSLRSRRGASTPEYVLMTALMMAIIPGIAQVSTSVNGTLARADAALSGTLRTVVIGVVKGQQTASGAAQQGGGTSATNPGAIATGSGNGNIVSRKK